MVLIEILKHTYEHSWEDISMASWKKYPSPSRPDVLSVDLVEKSFDPKTGILKTKRVVALNLGIPQWISRIVGCPSRCYFLEEAEIDPINKKMVLVGKNLSLRNYIEMKETCTYTPHPENKQWTFFEQEAAVKAFYYGLSGKVEEFGAQVFRNNAHKGRELMELTIARLKKEAEEKMNYVEDLGSRIKQDFQQMKSEKTTTNSLD